MTAYSAYVLQQDSIDGSIYQGVDKDEAYVPYLSLEPYGASEPCPDCPPAPAPPTTGQLWPRGNYE